MSNDKNDMMNNDDAIATKIYYDNRWQRLLWQKMMRMMYDWQEQLWEWWNLLKMKTIMITVMTNRWILSKKIVCDADAMKSLCVFWLILLNDFFFLWMILKLLAIVDIYSALFWLSFYLAEMLHHMIRDDKMKLCDKNVLEHDNKVSLTTCDSYDESEVPA